MGVADIVRRGGRYAALAVDGVCAVTLGAECGACGSPLSRLFDGPVCANCWDAVRVLSPPLCPRCGAPVAASPASSACRACRAASRLVTHERAVGLYDGALRSIIHAFKYGKHVSLAPRLGRLVQRAGAEVLQDADACVPVPLHWRRRRARGFNQAHLLARELGLPVWSALRRTRHTHSQASLHAADRRGNVAGAFAARRWARTTGDDTARRWRWSVRRTDGLVQGATVVLVDDVTTTGATLDACARALLDMGAREVRAVTIARVAVRAGR